MSKNPYINALLAAAYIVFVVLLITYGPAYVRDTPAPILAPVALPSLLVFSVALMGYLFFLQPVAMYLEGQKREAMELFTKTLGCFAVITGVVLIFPFAF